MRHLVIGAGATLAEALEIGTARENCPPLIGDFARKTWGNFNPHPALEDFLREEGHHDLGQDARPLFYQLESEGATSIEGFLEFVWNNRHRSWGLVPGATPPGYISGGRLTATGPGRFTLAPDPHCTYWENLLYFGVGSPLALLLSTCFHEQGVGWKEMRLSKTVASSLHPGDLVLNLNYDTVFEIALAQLGRPFAYAPFSPSQHDLLVCKPHGSLNMLVAEHGLRFRPPHHIDTVDPEPGWRVFSGIVPPRLNKQYSQHPLARLLLSRAQGRKPRILTMWGVGLTPSDQELIALYGEWAATARVIEVINPSKELAHRASLLFGREVRHFSTVREWHVTMAR